MNEVLKILSENHIPYLNCCRWLTGWHVQKVMRNIRCTVPYPSVAAVLHTKYRSMPKAGHRRFTAVNPGKPLLFVITASSTALSITGVKSFPPICTVPVFRRFRYWPCQASPCKQTFIEEEAVCSH